MLVQERPESDAEREKSLAEARKFDAETRKLEAEYEQEQIAADKARTDRLEVLAGDNYNRVYQFVTEVNSTTVSACITKLTAWARMDPEAPITIVFNSPGGSVVPGLQLFDFVRDLREGGIRVTVKALGIAASMAGILLQAGDVRIMGREAWILIHEASFAAAGTTGQVEDQVEWVKKVQERILDIFAERSKVKRTFIKSHWTRKNWWLSSDDCIKYGFVDKVE